MPRCTAADDANHGPGCGCAPRLGRRGLMGVVAGLASAAALPARAGSDGTAYEAMLLNCIDPRFTTAGFQYMGAQGMRDRYSQFVIAGGPIGAVHPRFASWHEAFWNNLAISAQLHRIRGVVALAHRDCGAAKLALGEDSVANRDSETAAFTDMLRKFQAELARRQPGLGLVAGIMDLDGSVQRVA